LRFFDLFGLTHQQIDALLALARETQTDLPIPAELDVGPIENTIGFYNPPPIDIITIDIQFRDLDLSYTQCVILFMNIIHESLHRQEVKPPPNRVFHKEHNIVAEKRAGALAEEIQQRCNECPR